MNTHSIYKGLKAVATDVAPAFYYFGQYLKGKDNTSYVVPAVYIEMPKNLQWNFFAQKVMVARNTEVKFHLITNAPFKHSDGLQDSNLAEHQDKLDALTKLLTGFVLKDANGKLLTQQLIPVASNTMNYEGAKVYSVLTFKTEFLSRSLQAAV